MCPNCSNEVPLDSTFCPSCGKPTIQESTEPVNAFEVLNPSLLYYFGTLIILGLFKLTGIFPAGFSGMVWINAINVLIVIGFWLKFSDDLRGLYSIKNIELSIIGSVVIGAIAGGFLVSIVANFIQVTINDDVFYNYYLFQDTASPKLFAIIFICVQPAIFEEVAFRGFLFNNIGAITSPQTAVYVTSILFGVLHLSFISLIWLVPIGLVFALLRKRYGTLWYGMIGHFCYNFTVISIEYFQLL